MAQSITGFRTKLMPEARAISFARCLAARGQATDVQVVESGRTQSTERRHFVYWTPRNVERHRQILADAQNSREERAREQRESYEFHLDESGKFYWCLNLKSMEVYEVTTTDCDCPDKCCNLRGLGLLCKHSLMLEMHLTEEAERVEQDRQIEEQQEEEAAEEHARAGYEQAEREAWEGREWQHLASRADGKSAEYQRRMQEDFPDF